MVTEAESNSAANNPIRNQICNQSRLFLPINYSLNLTNYHNSILFQHQHTAKSILVFIARLSLIAASIPTISNVIPLPESHAQNMLGGARILSSDIILLLFLLGQQQPILLISMFSFRRCRSADNNNVTDDKNAKVVEQCSCGAEWLLF